jgi:hypothetical protein
MPKPMSSALMICFCGSDTETVVGAMLVDDEPPAQNYRWAASRFMG